MRKILVLLAFLAVGCVSAPVDPGVAVDTIPLAPFPAVWSEAANGPPRLTILADQEPPGPTPGLPEAYQPLDADDVSRIAYELQQDLISEGYSVPDDCFVDAVILMRREDSDFVAECGSENGSTLLGCYQAPGAEHHRHYGAYAIVFRWDILYGISGLRESTIRHEFAHRALDCLEMDPDAAHDHPVWDLL